MNGSSKETRPDRIHVDGQVVRIRWLRSIGQFAVGYEIGGDYGGNVIRVAKGQTRNGQRAVVVHELMHHCVERAGLKMPAKEEEQFINAIDAFLLAALRENPALVEWLTETDE
jgi:hypothetical protein